MARAEYIQPNLEEWLAKFHFKTKVHIRFCETDMSGHVNNTSHLIYFEQGRVEYFDNMGFGEMILHEKAELMVVVADITCHYHSEAFFRETLEMGVRVARMGNRSLDLEYYLMAENEKRLVATGRGTIVLVNKKTRKSVPIPQAAREKIVAFEQMEMSG
ncbi:thioesterase family protein [Aneurinibacillus thermoaerophilus]|uniref:acyl-CoA thioesterase n=1 Tax=Aneurinibacillus thermoaerophilus TaxID=143495 RepID=UPI002E1E3877|nr:thioesterase family protein [Aneurinibacillus thermoaerophilus]MED0736399.1 thioesterase family protein [Aneurinibacillus thermoaerophilus]MED0763062.1 thioesterase family protein [Aneurinibacillus thermoaerophilus]